MSVRRHVNRRSLLSSHPAHLLVGVDRWGVVGGRRGRDEFGAGVREELVKDSCVATRHLGDLLAVALTELRQQRVECACVGRITRVGGQEGLIIPAASAMPSCNNGCTLNAH